MRNKCELTTEGDYLPGNTSHSLQRGFTDRLKLNNWSKTEHYDCEGSQAGGEAHIPVGACPWRPCAHGAKCFVLAAFPLRLWGRVRLCQHLPPPPLLLRLPGKKWKVADLIQISDTGLNSAWHSSEAVQCIC